MVVLWSPNCVFYTIFIPRRGLLLYSKGYEKDSTIRQVGIQAVAILFRLYNASIFTSYLYGHAQPCVAGNACSGCKFWHRVSFWSHHHDYNDVHLALKDQV